MNTKRAMKWSGLGTMGVLLALAAMPGCELLVSFDRSKIPTADASVPTDGGEDAGMMDGTVSDAPPADGSPDAFDGGGTDAPADVQLDAGPDAPTDTGTADALPDTGNPDAPADTGNPDAPADTGADAPADTGADAPAEAGNDSGDEGGGEAAADAGDDGAG